VILKIHKNNTYETICFTSKGEYGSALGYTLTVQIKDGVPCEVFESFVESNKYDYKFWSNYLSIKNLTLHLYTFKYFSFNYKKHLYLNKEVMRAS